MHFLTVLDTPSILFPIALTLGVTFVNGWTDAPSSITSVVTTKILPMGKACLFSGVLNFIGVLASIFVGGRVAETVFSLTDSYQSICASLLTVIVYGIVAWFFAIPTSESLALLGALCGASAFVTNSFTIKKCILPFFFALLSALASFAFSFLLVKCLKKKNPPKDSIQIFSCALSSFIHGAQDGQKFIGILFAILGFSYTSKDFSPKISITLTVAAFMLLGTLLGGGRIVDTLGNKTTRLNKRSAFSSDIGCFASLLLCTLLGMPVSTGNAKATAIMGAGLGDGEKINKKTATELIVISVATVPICFFLGYFLCALLY